MEATTNPTTNPAQLLGLPEKSAEFFAALAADAGNWSGCPWLSGNVQPGRSSSGMSQTLVRAGLIELGEDDGDVYAIFTAAGCAAAELLGIDLYEVCGIARPAAPVAETPAEPVAERSMTCPDCGYRFSKPQVRCNSRTACERRQRQGRLDLALTEATAYNRALNATGDAEYAAWHADVVADRVADTPAEVENARIARAETTEPRRQAIVTDWLNRDPADVLDEYVADLRRRHAAAAAEGSVIEPALAAQVAEQERQLAWVRARSSK